MAWTVSECSGSPFRTLICEADTAEDLSTLRSKAEKKGWTLLAEGTVPGSPRLGIWFTKPAEGLSSPPAAPAS
jgi:hypothetical protein